MQAEQLFTLLDKLDIKYKNYNHEPVFTVEQGLYLQELIPGAHSKNLFLRNKKKSYYCLLSLIETKTVDLKTLSDLLGHGRLSFGSKEDMLTLLNLTPGSVCPFGIINDTENKIEFLLDKDFLNYDSVNFHPMQNDKTINLNTKDFLSFFDKVNKTIQYISVPVSV